MDTNTVNYAINKLIEGYHAIAPTVQNISEKYVHYVVMKQFAILFISLLTIPLASLLLFSAIKLLKTSKTYKCSDESDEFEVCGLVSIVIGIILTIIGVISIPINSYDAFLAYTNPEMFTVEQIIQKAK